MKYRPFRNTDPPGLIEVWRSQPPQRRRAQGISVDTLERHIFCRPFFEREGLIVAEDQNRIVGFAHGGFAPTVDGDTLDTRYGVISALMATPNAGAEVMPALLEAAEAFLEQRGAESICAGGVGRICPFYWGLYGGSGLPGILKEDPALSVFQSAGYQAAGATEVLDRSLLGFRPVVDRTLMQIRRAYHIEAALDPPAKSWWEACTTADSDRTEFRLETRDDHKTIARVLFWEMQPFSQSWGMRAMGLGAMEVHFADDEESLLVFLLGEALRQLQSQGVSLVETQLPVALEGPTALAEAAGALGESSDAIPVLDESDNVPREVHDAFRARLLHRFGFETSATGVTLWKGTPARWPA